MIFLHATKKNENVKFHKLKVAEVKRETAQCVSIVFDIPAELKEDYKYQAGQYITIKMNVGGEEVRRSYSLCSSPVVNEPFRVAVKKVDSGAVSPFLTDTLKAGDELDVMTPTGGFTTPIDAANNKTYVLFAGGSGITPVMSILKTVLTQEPQSKVVLVYANETESAIIFNNELNEWKGKYTDRLSIYHVLNAPVASVDDTLRGIMTVEKTKEVVSKYITLADSNEYFICGPGPMMQNIENSLKELGVSKEKVHLEYFTTVLNKEEAPKVVDESAEIMSEVTVIMDGDEYTFNLSSKGQPILDAAIEAGVDAPFSCKGAVCATCKGQVIEGKARMEQNYSLGDGEVEEGYILTCQAHPLTEKVVVDYDVI